MSRRRLERLLEHALESGGVESRSTGNQAAASRAIAWRHFTARRFCFLTGSARGCAPKYLSARGVTLYVGPSHLFDRQHGATNDCRIRWGCAILQGAAGALGAWTTDIRESPGYTSRTNSGLISVCLPKPSYDLTHLVLTSGSLVDLATRMPTDDLLAFRDRAEMRVSYLREGLALMTGGAIRASTFQSCRGLISRAPLRCVSAAGKIVSILSENSVTAKALR